MNYRIVAIKPVIPATFGPQIIEGQLVELESIINGNMDTVKLNVSNDSWLAHQNVGDVISITPVV
jgi:hypothetical protein